MTHPRQSITSAVRYVFHLASPAAPRHYQRLPVQTLLAGSAGTYHALDVAGRHGARFVFASAAEVYGDPRLWRLIAEANEIDDPLRFPTPQDVGRVILVP